MVLLYIIGQLGCGGTEKQLYLLSSELKKRNHDITVISLSKENSYYDKFFIKKGINVEFLEGSYIRKYIGISRIIAKTKPDVVHAVFWYVGIYPALYFLFHKRTKFIIGERSIIFTGLRWVLLRILPYLIADAVIFNSNRVQKSLNKFLSILCRKRYYIPNGFESYGLMDNVDRGEASSKIILTISNLTPVKRTEWVIRAFYDSHAVDEGYLLWVGGVGPREEALQMLVRRLGMGNSVSFLGFVKNVDKVLNQCKFFTLASKHEGMSNVIGEAMLAKKLVLSTNAGDVQMLIPDEKYGMVTPDNSYECYLKCFKEVLKKDDAELSKIGVNGYRQIISNFSVSLMGKKYLELYCKTKK